MGNIVSLSNHKSDNENGDNSSSNDANIINMVDEYNKLDDMTKSQIVDYIKQMKIVSLKIDETFLDKTKDVQLECMKLLPQCVELYEKLQKILPETTVQTTSGPITAKKFFVRPKFSQKQVSDTVVQQDNSIKHNMNVYQVKQPTIPFKKDPITLDEFNLAFNDTNYKKDMIGISKKILSSLSNYHKQTFVNHYNKLYRKQVDNGMVSIGRASYIYKSAKNGPKDDINSFRQIITIPTIVNHFHRIMALRLNDFFIKNNLIDTTIQKAGVSGQKNAIFQQVCKIKEVLKQANSSKSTCSVMFLDLTNAFGNINRDSLFQILSQYQVDPELISYLKTYYENFEYYVKTNDWSSDLYKWGGGLIQGCPMSPILFAVIMNYVLTHMESFKEEHGFLLSNGSKIMQLAFMDDICLICKDDKSLMDMYTKLKELLKMIGLEINTSKTAIMTLNSNTNFDGTSLKDIPKVANFKYLGEYISSNGTNTESYSKFLSQLGRWLYIIDKKDVDNDEKIGLFNRWVMSCIHRKLTIMYDLTKNQKINIVKMISKYMEKWGNKEPIQLFSDLNIMIGNIKDDIIEKLEITVDNELQNDIDLSQYITSGENIEFLYDDENKAAEIENIIQQV